MQKTTKTVHELTWQVRGPPQPTRWLFQPSHAFCLDKVQKIDSNDPPLALYEKKIHLFRSKCWLYFRREEHCKL